MTVTEDAKGLAAGPWGGDLEAGFGQRLRSWRAAVRANLAAVGAERSPCLVVVGPNNAGKTSLVRALGGREARPSALGGATSQVLLHGPVAAGEPWIEGALVAGEVDQDHGWLLVDTPDFDGHLLEHHRLAAGAVRAADLVALVVTPLVYANARVHEFMGTEVLDRGLPWVLVVRGAGEAEARRVSAALASQVGGDPAATYSWEQEVPVRVEVSGAVLSGAVLSGPGRTGAGGSLLQDLTARGQDRSRLREGRSSMRQRLLAEGASLLEALGHRARALEAVLERGREELRELARAVATEALPLEEAVLALRELLDPRVHPLRRALRAGTGRLGRLLRGSAAPLQLDLQAAERRALERELPAVLERLEGLLRAALAEGVGPRCRATLEDWLRPVRRGAALDQGRSPAPASATDRAAFREELRGLLEGALEERGGEGALQLQMDLVLTTPMAVGSLIALKTGGLGSDLVVGGLGVLSSAWLERLASHLGSSVATEARSRWARRAAARLEEHLEAHLWRRCEEALQVEVRGLRTVAERVRETLGALREGGDA